MRPDDLAPGDEHKVTNTGWGGGTDSKRSADPRGTPKEEPTIEGNKLTTGYETASSSKSAPPRGSEPNDINDTTYSRGDVGQSSRKPRRIDDKVRRIDPYA